MYTGSENKYTEMGDKLYGEVEVNILLNQLASDLFPVLRDFTSEANILRVQDFVSDYQRRPVKNTFEVLSKDDYARSFKNFLEICNWAEKRDYKLGNVSVNAVVGGIYSASSPYSRIGIWHKHPTTGEFYIIVYGKN